MILDIDFYQAAVWLLNYHFLYRKNKYSRIELKKAAGARFDTVFQDMIRNGIAHETTLGDYVICPPDECDAYYSECMTELERLCKKEKWLTVRLWLGVAGFVISLLSFGLSLFNLDRLPAG